MTITACALALTTIINPLNLGVTLIDDDAQTVTAWVWAEPQAAPAYWQDTRLALAWNGPESPQPFDVGCVHWLFDECAADTPCDGADMAYTMTSAPYVYTFTHRTNLMRVEFPRPTTPGEYVLEVVPGDGDCGSYCRTVDGDNVAASYGTASLTVAAADTIRITTTAALVDYGVPGQFTVAVSLDPVDGGASVDFHAMRCEIITAASGTGSVDSVWTDDVYGYGWRVVPPTSGGDWACATFAEPGGTLTTGGVAFTLHALASEPGAYAVGVVPGGDLVWEWALSTGSFAVSPFGGGAFRPNLFGDYVPGVLIVPKPGDVNADGRVDYDDVTPFLAALQDGDTFYERCPSGAWHAADVNADGAVDYRDVTPFVTVIK